MFSLQIQAQEAAPTATSAQTAEDKSFQEIINAPLIAPRSQDDIQADIKSSQQDVAAADKRITTALDGLNKANQMLQLQKGEVDALKKKIDLVKKEKREADKISLEAEKKKADLIEDFLEKYRTVAEAGVDEAKSEKDLSQAQIGAFTAELELSQKREDRDKAGSAAMASANLNVSTAQDKALRAFKTVADKNKGVADKLSNLANKRIDLFQIQAKLVK